MVCTFENELPVSFASKPTSMNISIEENLTDMPNALKYDTVNSSPEQAEALQLNQNHQ